MKDSIKWMAHNHVAANLLMMVFIVGGLLLGVNIKQEVFPEVVLDRVQISVAYPGASPDEVEEGIILPIEDNISGVDGLKEMTAMAREGSGTVTAVIQENIDPDLFLQDIKAEVDRITTFPAEAEKPVIAKMVNRREVASLVIYGDASERALREQAEAIRDELLDMPGITQAELSGVRPYEISVEISETNLRRYNLTLTEVAKRIGKASLDLPGGTVKAAGGEILIRTKAKRYLGAEYGKIVIITTPDGMQVRLQDIAEIRDGFAETDESARFNGMPAASVAVYRVGDQKPTEIADLIKQYVTQKQPTLPDSLKLAIWNDSSELLKGRMQLLIKNAAMGLILVMVTLSLFLQIRLALWVMLGIPISFLGALFLMPALGVSINMVSLFAFIMALGIVVDDAIVIGENIYEHRQQGKPYLQAAVDGAREVAVPVVFSILTSVAAFMPLLAVTGTMGKFIRVIPLVVISILVISLVESIYVLPAHLSIGKHRDKEQYNAFERLRLRFSAWLQRLIDGPYRKTLAFCLGHRYLTLAIAVAFLLVSVGLVKGGVIKFRFMPVVDSDQIKINLAMPLGTPVTETATIQRHIEQTARKVIEDFDQEQGTERASLRQLFAVAGSALPQGGAGSNGDSASGSHLAGINLRLIPSEERDFPAQEITTRIRKAVGEIPGIDSLSFSSNLMHVGANIDIQLAHENFDVLTRSAARLKESLGQYPGVGDIADTYPEGKTELKLRLKPAARTLGLTEEELGKQMRGAFYGAEALRIQRGRNEVKVMVRYPEATRNKLKTFEEMRIRTTEGIEIPLAQAAEIEPGHGFSTINRHDRKRVVDITADVDSEVANAEDILKELKATTLANLVNDYPGLSYNLEGEEKERRESMASMGQGFLFALFAIYALLAIPFRSYSQPLLIMTAIPFGIVGALAGHLLMGYDLSIMSVFGIVALSGVVVNDSLLLIDKINRDRTEGLDPTQAVVDAGCRRFRPILLTSLTTFFGLTPMILETSVQARFLIPMAISLGFGIMFATGVTLILIPTLYMTLEDIKGLLRPAAATGS
ncbi:MAG: efflux RND transporter permease subunit [Desulfobulbaceae bacterium]|nr:efflux RND transporter permease subunit [Desulfobulbaceae bacterium]